ncbi:MAG TPA: hypothetical protein VJS11_09885 [Acidobacteriaceae bacterium]|nr:hypothetical protein [Acidobacteriaceae bacterium]
MRYGVFEAAAIEASHGVQEIDDQMQQISVQMEQLKSRKNQLETLARQLQTLASEGAVAGAETAFVQPAVQEPAEAAETPATPELPLPESQPAEPVLAGGDPPPPGWFSRRYTSGVGLRSSGIFPRR